MQKLIDLCDGFAQRALALTSLSRKDQGDLVMSIKAMPEAITSEIRGAGDQLEADELLSYMQRLVQDCEESSRPDLMVGALMGALPLVTVIAAEHQERNAPPDKYAGQRVLATDRMFACHTLSNGGKPLGTGFYTVVKPDIALMILMTSSATQYLPRGPLERNPKMKQIIPYVALFDTEGFLLTYGRGKRGAEDRLHAQRSWGFGGHINPDGQVPTVDTFRRTVDKELQEECGIKLDDLSNVMVLGFVNNEDDEVGQVHLGVVVFAVVSSDVVERMKFDEGDGIVDPEWVPPHALMENYLCLTGEPLHEKLEGWSRIAAPALACYADLHFHGKIRHAYPQETVDRMSELHRQFQEAARPLRSVPEWFEKAHVKATNPFDKGSEEHSDWERRHRASDDGPIEDDLGDLDPSKACTNEGGACESCQ